MGRRASAHRHTDGVSTDERGGVVGVTHVEGGPFSRWHARHERWVAEVVGRLVDGEDPSEFRHPYNNADQLTYALEWALSR